MKKKFLTLGWMIYWLIGAFIIMLPLSIWLTASLPKDDSYFRTIILLWIFTLAIIIAVVFGIQQITEISEEGILQKNPFGKKVFFKWEEIKQVATLNIFAIMRFIYITNQEFTNAELWNMSPLNKKNCLIRIVNRKVVKNAIKTFYNKEIVELKSK